MIIVVPVNGMRWKKAYAVMAKANIVLISDTLMIAANVGRANNANSGQRNQRRMFQMWKNH